MRTQPTMRVMVGGVYEKQEAEPENKSFAIIRAVLNKIKRTGQRRSGFVYLMTQPLHRLGSRRTTARLLKPLNLAAYRSFCTYRASRQARVPI